MDLLKNGTFARCCALSLAVGALIYGLSQANAQDSGMPFDKPTDIGGVETVCTGVSLDAREEPGWNAYPLKVELAGKGGQYLGDAHLLVAKDGKRVVELTCGGPWILFKLLAGRYQIEATIENKTASSAAYVPASGQGRIILRFPDMGGELETVSEANPPHGE
ncbi:MAG TPA: hypothetical protein VNH44_05675 [Micropepsaceae bacterium]|nr:hypothetical protein [Micropepsaceae bacterium]